MTISGQAGQPPSPMLRPFSVIKVCTLLSLSHGRVSLQQPGVPCTQNFMVLFMCGKAEAGAAAGLHHDAPLQRHQGAPSTPRPSRVGQNGNGQSS